MTKHKEMQFIIREWKKATGNIEIDMHLVADFAVKRGWPLPEPVSALDRLAKEFSQAAREETRQDTQTGRPYRVYHAYPSDSVGQGMFWIDIDEAPRKIMVKSAVMRREQVIGDMVQLWLDLDHWSRKNPNEEPIKLLTDVTPDVQERLAASDGSASGTAA
jgi:hypothetical protein